MHTVATSATQATSEAAISARRPGLRSLPAGRDDQGCSGRATVMLDMVISKVK
jgi:hypothetical protein